MKNNKIASLVLVYSLIQAATISASDTGLPKTAQSYDANRQIHRLMMQREMGAVLGCLTGIMTVGSAGLTYLLATNPSEDPRHTVLTGLAGLNTTLWGLATVQHRYNFRQSNASLLSKIQKDSKKN